MAIRVIGIVVAPLRTAPAFANPDGGVAERLNALDSKSSMAFGSSGVRIPPSPFVLNYPRF